MFLQDWVTKRAGKSPDKVAIVAADGIVTYGELEALSNQLARVLRDSGCGAGDRIALLIPKSALAIAAIVGIHKAGCICVPLDPNNPAARLSRILLRSESSCILIGGRGSERLEEILEMVKGRPLLVGSLEVENIRPRVDFTLREVLAQSSAAMPGMADGHVAYLLFTSGSTGEPKGVLVTHESIIAFVRWARGYFDIKVDDRSSGHTPLHFDLSIFDIFGTFAAGAELYLVPDGLERNPQRLANWIGRSQLTQWFSVPSLLNYLVRFDAVKYANFASVKRVMWCGEVFPTPALIYWMKRLPDVQFTNLYGPTEATIASSYYTVPACPESETAIIPIGEACDGEELLVLDEDLEPSAPGEVGELFICGVGLSPGYWQNPVATQQAFLQRSDSCGSPARMYRTGDLARRDADGLIHFLGRKDSQIKTRGYRVELGEIEHALYALGYVKECAVVPIVTDGFEGTRVACACVLNDGSQMNFVQLRRDLLEKLPSYMIPTKWLSFRELPKNANGKIDRPRLIRRFEGHDTEAVG